MAITIDNVQIETFEDNVRFLAQQKPSRLAGLCTMKQTNGAAHNWERVGPTDFSEKTTARTATPENDTPWSRRVSQAKTFDNGDTVEQEDIVQMLIDPLSTLTQNLAWGSNRNKDDVIIAAATADALDGDGNLNAFPAGQEVGDYTTPISLDLINQMDMKFYENDIDPDEPKCVVISPFQRKTLLGLLEVTSGDFQGDSMALRNGYLPNFLGYDWIVSTRLLAPLAGQVDCLAFTKKAIGVQINRDISTRVAEDPSQSFMWRVYGFQTLGAVRVEDEHIVRLKLKNEA
ncbi:MAG: hypothetical protein GY937_12285 [bacterium]|nr:hypothetical protein [Alteromonadales bacterium]MCP5057485.1 hypothetical protein [bacterium]